MRGYAFTGFSMEARKETDWRGSAIEGLLAGGEIVPAQASSVCIWSPEKSLAAAVLATALTEIRDHYGDPKRCRRIADELAWIRSDANDRLLLVSAHLRAAQPRSGLGARDRRPLVRDGAAPSHPVHLARSRLR